MSKVIIIPPSDNLVGEVLAHVESDGLDYSRTVVVFPGKRPAHFLLRKLGEQLGRSCIPPRAFSIDTFVEYVCKDLLHQERRQIQPLDAVAILHQLHLAIPERLGGKSFDTLDSFIPLGLKMFSELEELTIAGISEPEVQSSLTPLNKFYGPFYQRLEQSGHTTRARQYWDVAKAIESFNWQQFRKIILAGFFALTNAERAIFSRLKALDNVVLVFQMARGIEKHLDELGVKDDDTVRRHADMVARPAGGVVAHYYRSPDTHGQAFGLAAKLRELIDKRQSLDERTVVVLPSPETLFPVVNHALKLLSEEQYNISLSYPLTRTPIYGFLQSLMDVVTSMYGDRLYAPDYIKFALHPYTKNILLRRRADVTRILFHTIEKFFAGEKSRVFFSLEELESETTIFEAAAKQTEAIDPEVSADSMKQHLRSIHDSTIRKLLKIRDVGDLARKCIDIVTFVDEHSTARMHLMFRPYVKSLMESLDETSTSLLGKSTFAEPAGYFSFLRHCLKSVEVPFPGTPVRGLQVLGLLETRNLQFDRVIILDANDDVIPGSGWQQTLIPVKVRESLGLPTHHDREDIIAYYVDLLVRGAKEVHFFYVENDKKVKSRYIEKLLWERQRAERKKDANEFIDSIRYHVALGNRLPQPIAKTQAIAAFLKVFKYNATALDSYLRCPLQFYYRHVLRLEEKEEVSGDIESAEVGSFVHKVLARLFAGVVGKSLQADSLRIVDVDKLVDDVFVEFFGNDLPAGKQLLKSQTRKQLRSFIEKYQAPLLKRLKVELLAVEKKIEIKKGAFLFEGRLDRIEKRGEQVFVLDYKTKYDDGSLRIRFDKLRAEERSTWNDAIGSLQLPLYALLYAGRFGNPMEEIVPAYLFLGTNQIDETIEVELFGEGESPAENYRLVENVLFKLLDEITDPSQPFLPTDDPRDNCPTCAFKYMCGTQWVRGHIW